MNKIKITVALVVAFALCAFSCNRQHISIRTNDTKDALVFTAHFPQERTAAVHKYVEACFKKQRIFTGEAFQKKTQLVLTDGTKFYLNHKPGFISIDLDRDKNSVASYDNVKKMIAGFGNVL